ncbi:MAG: DNA mismatch repair protein MutS [Dehalococcoidia bacterium]|nr:DNA mismatch repair protein MutS [Dehalococcoidia bacterium]
MHTPKITFPIFGTSVKIATRTMPDNDDITPIRRQYLQVKRSYPDTIVLFRLGDFYETFDDDARLVSKELEIVLTGRGMGKGQRVPMAGIPYHALDNYLGRLVGRGYKVAICEQLVPSGSVKGIVPRDVVRVITPGTVVEPGLLEGKANNYLAAVVADGELAGVAYVDITTSEFATTQLPRDKLQAEIERLHPAEILITKELAQSLAQANIALPGPVTHTDEQWFELETARDLLLRHFEAASLEGYGCAGLPLAIRAAGAIVHYLQDTQKSSLNQLNRLSTYSTQTFMFLDAPVRRHLELFQGGRLGGSSTLFSILDLTKTAMGGRLLKKWLGQPLLDLAELNRRLDSIQWFSGNTIPRTKLIKLLGEVADLERLSNRVRSGLAIPREVVSLKQSLELLPQIKVEIGDAVLSLSKVEDSRNGDEHPLEWLSTKLKPCPDEVALISQAINEAPSEGNVIRPGFSPELDSLRSLSKNAKQFLTNLERDEREKTGIKSLKVGYNQIFGYYIEVSKPHIEQVPPHYIRKQTLSNAERYFTPELKEYETQVLHAQERIEELEKSLFRQVCQQIGASGEKLLALGEALAQLDVLAALAEAAVRHNYVRPKLDEGNKIDIKGGRHPVVERTVPEFVPNDTYLSNQDAQLIVLTGPNMSGKSTYLRQVALIVLMAQIGSFVPAEAAAIGLVDRIFTRVGLMDDLAAGQSTFMVEMTETANILNNATPRSLIILDEIGRGTSTYDGISIARAVAEYIHNHPRLGAKTLFATHYHELVDLAGFLPRVKNFNVGVVEEGGKVVFLRKIVPGGADKSYGIHVAQLAGLPRAVIHRAQEILSDLESGRTEGVSGHRTGRLRGAGHKAPVEQLPLMPAKSAVEDELAGLDIDSLTPLEALTKLYELKKKAEGKG